MLLVTSVNAHAASLTSVRKTGTDSVSGGTTVIKATNQKSLGRPLSFTHPSGGFLGFFILSL